MAKSKGNVPGHALKASGAWDIAVLDEGMVSVMEWLLVTTTTRCIAYEHTWFVIISKFEIFLLHK